MPIPPRGGVSTIVLAPESAIVRPLPDAPQSGLVSRIREAPTWLLVVGAGLALAEALVLAGFAWRRLSERRSRMRRRLARRL
jgi:hypothetical protein